MKVIGILLVCVTAAFALDVHPDYRFGSGECPTWAGSGGKYKVVNVWARIFERYDFKTSNYPVGNEYRFVCQYMGDPDPVSSKPGEYVAKIASNCYAKTVLVNGEPKISYPVLTGGYSTEYNEGWSYGQVWCKWDPWAYGGGGMTTTTTLAPMGDVPLDPLATPPMP